MRGTGKTARMWKCGIDLSVLPGDSIRDADATVLDR
jgi:hypothetical protein